MELLHQLISFILHINDHLEEFCKQHGAWTYGLLFLIVFCETGLVVTPFLPGDSLLFAVGALSASGMIDIWTGAVVLFCAALCGDLVNYFVGKTVGAKLAAKERWFLKKKHLDQTHAFFEKHGGKAVIYARFVPIVRTMAPFVAGLGAMNFRRYIGFCIAGALLWIITMVGAGFFFGQMPFVKKHFELVVLAIIGISLMPIAWHALQGYLARKRPVAEGQPE